MIPSFINLVLAELLFQINLVFVSMLNDENMVAGIGLANAIIYCFPLSLTYGVSSVLETLVSQAYGSGEYYLCGLYLNRQIFVLTILFIPIAYIVTNSGSLLVSIFAQNEMASFFCQEYMCALLPGMYIYCIQLSYCFFFTAMEKSYIPMLIQIIFLPLHALLCYIFVFQLNLGFHGTTIAFNLTNFIID